ncbi:MAG: hypothetical protein AMS24_05015 [Chlamydiae bacterium SM23_39]|nr:MAG: hypothetical protein AMS24_05015 [Chlamydiae bacterium SM23_39]
MKDKILKFSNKVEICFKGLLVFIERDISNKEIILKTTVFSERDFVPISIRKCVKKIFEKNKKAFLSIDEKRFAVDFIQKIPLKAEKFLLKIIRLYLLVAKSWALILKKLAEQDFLNV